MKINFLGDSITEGACASSTEKRYSSLVCKMLGATENNYGIGGTRIAKQTNVIDGEVSNDFCTRAQTMDKYADVVLVLGGTNDYGHGDAEIGNIEDDKTANTFCGSLKWLVEYLLSVYGRERVRFILPLHRYNEDNLYGEGNKAKAGAPLSAYVQAEIDIFNRYNVEYLDLSEVFPIPKANNGDELTQDGLHPNDRGHLLLAEKIVEYLNENKISLVK